MFLIDIVNRLKKNTQQFTRPLIDTVVKEFGHDPFLILIACLLSLRAKDTVTVHVCRDLFSKIKTPGQLCALSRMDLEKIVYTSGFYKTKARVLHGVSAELIQRFNSKVPSSIEDLLSIKGIGLKTAHLVAGYAFKIPAICVDTHVHRISNRLGIITTRTAIQTEQALSVVVPKKYWIVWNTLLVMWGQNICTPVSPKCSNCAIRLFCKRVNVGKSR